MAEEGIKLTLMETDALKEISNLGSAKATNTLSALIGKPVGLTVPYTRILLVERIGALLSGTHEVLAYTPVEMFGQKKAALIMVFERSAAATLVNLMTKQPATATHKLEDMDLSTLIELAHILNNAYLNPLANFFGEKFKPKNTQIVLDAGAVISELIEKTNPPINYGLVIGTDFMLPDEKTVEGKFILFIDEVLLRKLLDALDRRMVIRRGKIF